MTYRFLLNVFFLFPAFVFSQFGKTIPVFYRKTTAILLVKGDTTDKRVTYTNYDSLWNVINDENFPGGKFKFVTVFQDERKLSVAKIDSLGDTLGISVKLFDGQKKPIYHYEIRNGDTLISQKRVYDIKGNNTELYNRYKGKYYLFMSMKYDDNNELIYQSTYNHYGALIMIDKYERDESGEVRHFVIDSKNWSLKSTKIPVSNTINKISYFYDFEGFNYGIPIKIESGGYSITENDLNGNMKKYEIYNANNELTVLVSCTYHSYK